MRLFRNGAMACMLVMAGSGAFAQTTFIVPATSVTARGTGASWDSPLKGNADLATAITGGGNVYIQQGAYSITSTINLNQTTHFIQGGFPSSATGTDLSGYAPQTNVTTITGTTAQMFHKLAGTTVAITLKGLELTGVTYAGGNGAVISSSGDNTQLNFLDLNVHDNAVTGIGATGGFAFIQNMSLNNNSININNCLFQNNSASSTGGAIEFSAVENTIDFSSNIGTDLITGCSFVGNSGHDNGGALHFSNAEGFTITNNSFCSNTTTGVGSGMYMTTVGAMQLDGNTFNNNTAGGTQGTALFLASVSGTGITINHDTTANQAGTDIFSATTSGSIPQTISNSSLESPASAYANFVPAGTGDVFSATPASAPVCKTYAQILPAIGLVLTGSLVNGHPVLTWGTLQEQNTRYFSVEASTNASTFTGIGQVDAAGNSVDPLHYTFTDMVSTGNVMYYRIRLVDLDGHSSYSNIFALRLGGSTAAGVRVYPNPAASLANVETGAAGNYMIELFGIDGRRVQVNQLSTGSGLLTVPLNRNNIPTGMYMLKVTNVNGGEPSYNALLIK